MSNYDNEHLGHENPAFPPNLEEIEVIELTDEQKEIQDLRMSINELQRINSNMQRIYNENFISLSSPKEYEGVGEYIRLRELFNHKLNKI